MVYKYCPDLIPGRVEMQCYWRTSRWYELMYKLAGSKVLFEGYDESAVDPRVKGPQSKGSGPIARVVR